MKKKLIFGLCLLILVVIFTLQNSQSVPLKIFLWAFNWPVALIIIISLTIGAVLGLLFSIQGKKPESEKKEKKDDTPLT